MYNWSVLNDSIRDFLTTPASFQNFQEKISWDMARFQINNIVRQLNNAKSPEELYAVVDFHRCWHNAEINRMLFSALNGLRNRFGNFYIDMLIEMFSQAAYITQDDHQRRESDYARMVEFGFPDLFPELSDVKREAAFDDFRADLLAKEPYSGRDVLFELKLGTCDPTPQLKKYASSFAQPILIGITEKRLPEYRESPEVYYFTYRTLNQRAAANIRKQFGGTEKFFSYSSSKFDHAIGLIQNKNI